MEKTKEINKYLQHQKKLFILQYARSLVLLQRHCSSLKSLNQPSISGRKVMIKVVLKNLRISQVKLLAKV
jgi:hypothetical protein